MRQRACSSSEGIGCQVVQLCRPCKHGIHSGEQTMPALACSRLGLFRGCRVPGMNSFETSVDIKGLHKEESPSSGKRMHWDGIPFLPTASWRKPSHETLHICCGHLSARQPGAFRGAFLA
jgi:hypothetical protein